MANFEKNYNHQAGVELCGSTEKALNSIKGNDEEIGKCLSKINIPKELGLDDKKALSYIKKMLEEGVNILIDENVSAVRIGEIANAKDGGNYLIDIETLNSIKANILGNYPELDKLVPFSIGTQIGQDLMIKSKQTGETFYFKEKSGVFSNKHRAGLAPMYP